MPGPVAPILYHAPPSQPLGWYGLRTSQRGSSTIFPSQVGGAQVMMRRNLIDRLKPSDDQMHLTHPSTYMQKDEGLQIVLSKQRVPATNFIGLRTRIDKAYQNQVSQRLYCPYRQNKSPTLSLPEIKRGPKYTLKEIDKVTERLSSYDPARVPESKGYRVASATSPEMAKPTEKKADEIDEITKRLANYDKTKHPPDSKGYKQSLPSFLPSKKALKEPSPRVQKLISRLGQFDRLRWPPESGSLGKLCSNTKSTSSMSMKKIKVSKDVLEQIIERLSQYNPEKWPPGSEKKQREAKNSKPVSKEISDAAREIVDRLTKFDTKRWPAESRGTKEKIWPPAGTPSA